MESKLASYLFSMTGSWLSRMPGKGARLHPYSRWTISHGEPVSLAVDIVMAELSIRVSAVRCYVVWSEELSRCIRLN